LYKELSVHGCIYNLETGLLKDLDARYSEIDHTNEIYQLREAKKEIYKPALSIKKSVALLEE